MISLARTQASNQLSPGSASPEQDERNRVLEMLACGAPRQAVLAELVCLVEIQNPGSLASIMLLDQTGTHLRAGSCDSLPEAYVRAIDGMAIGPGAGSCGTAAHSGKAVVVEDIAADPLWKDYRELGLAHGLRACWSVPIKADEGRVLGTFAVYYREPRRPSEAELGAAAHAADIAGIAIAHWRDHDRLREGEQQMRHAMLAARIGLWRWNIVEDNFVTSANMGPMLGLPENEHYGDFATFIGAVHDGDRDRVNGDIRRAIDEGAAYNNEFRVVWPGGSVHWIAGRGSVERDGQGRALAMFGIAMDITERKLLEQRAAERQTEVEHLARIDVINSMGASLAHEMNQPLAAIIYTLWAALRRCEARDSGADGAVGIKAMIEDALGQAERAAQIVQRLRDFSAKHSPHREPIDVGELLRAASEIAGVGARRNGVHVEVAPVPEPLAAHADLLQIEQVLVNLMRNAIEAMEATTPRARRVTLSARRDESGMVEIAVADCGCGLFEHDLARVFEPFYSARDGGAGIGLGICHNIVEAHGGRIWLENNPAQGATARFTLPCAARS